MPRAELGSHASPACPLSLQLLDRAANPYLREPSPEKHPSSRLFLQHGQQTPASGPLPSLSPPPAELTLQKATRIFLSALNFHKGRRALVLCFKLHAIEAKQQRAVPLTTVSSASKAAASTPPSLDPALTTHGHPERAGFSAAAGM